MLRCSWVLLFAACSYTPPSTDPAGDGDDDPGVDAPVVPPVARTCATTGTSLCIEFEQGIAVADNMDVALDGSGGERDAVATNVVATRRDFPASVPDDDAAGFGVTSSLAIAKDLGVGKSFTVAMWIQAVPGATRRWLFDGNRRFFVSLGGDHKLRCGIDFAGSDDSNLHLDSNTKIDDGNWHHIACTFDDSSTVIRVYIDGTSDNDCRRLNRRITSTGVGATIGALQGRAEEHFLGSIDSVLVFDRPLSGTEICTLRGGGSCQSVCDTSTGIEIDVEL